LRFDIEWSPTSLATALHCKPSVSLSYFCDTAKRGGLVRKHTHMHAHTHRCISAVSAGA